MRSELAEKTGTLVVFSFGAPLRLRARIKSLAGDVQKIIWVDPLLDDAAVGRFDLDTAIEQIGAVVVPAGKTAELLGYSLPDLYSLTPASAALTSLLPGLREGHGVKVSAISARSLMSRFKSLNGPVHVVIDTPGAEATIVDVLSRRPLAGAVKTVWMRCGVEPFFNKSQGAAALVERLDGLGFVVETTGEDDPDWPEFTLTFDARAQQIKTLEAAKSKLASDIKTQRASVGAARKDARSARAALAKLEQEHASVLADMEGETEVMAALRADLQARQKERDDARALSAQYAEALEKCRLDLDAYAKESDDAKTAEAQHPDAMLRLRMKKQALTVQLDEAERRAAHDRQQIQTDIRRAVLAQERALADADVLKTRLATAEEDRQSLRRLLQQLTPRLREAAKYARDVTLDVEPEAFASLLDAQVEKPKKKKKKKRKPA